MKWQASKLGIILAAGMATLVCAGPFRAEGGSVSEQGRAAALKGLAFTEKDAAEWKAVKKCASCHQGVMSAWTFAEAQRFGYPARPELVNQLFEWSKERFAGIDNPREKGKQFDGVSTPALLFGLMADANPGMTALPPTEITRIGDHLLRYQDEDGSWTWTAAPAKNRPPPVMESDEVATLLAAISLENRRPADRTTATAVGTALDRAAAYLSKTPDGDTTQAVALRLYYAVRTGASKKEREAKIEALLKRQQPDGGWAQTPQLYSDAYATGQALYFLNLAGVKPSRSEIRRGISFLAITQRADGSWRVVPRAHPGARPFTHPEPIGSFGTCWATMALMRLVPPK